MRTRPPAQPLPLLGMQTKKKSSPTPMSALMAIKPVGYSLICPKQGCAAGQGVAFDLSVLN